MKCIQYEIPSTLFRLLMNFFRLLRFAENQKSVEYQRGELQSDLDNI